VELFKGGGVTDPTFLIQFLVCHRPPPTSFQDERSTFFFFLWICFFTERHRADTVSY